MTTTTTGRAAMSYSDARQLLARAREPGRGKPVANNTRLHEHARGVAVRLHTTDVVVLHPDGTYTLDSGGWRTMTTRDRIETYSPARIVSREGVWTVDGRAFEDGMVVGPFGDVRHGGCDLAAHLKCKRTLDRDVRAFVKRYAAAVDAGGVAVPGPGDCFFCAAAAGARRPERDGLGRFVHCSPPGGVEHVIEHIREAYYVPSLLAAAMREQGYPDGAAHATLGVRDGRRAAHVLRGFFKRLKPALLASVAPAAPRGDAPRIGHGKRCPARWKGPDGERVAPRVATCGGCHHSWCDRCDPAPGAACPFCAGRGYSPAYLERRAGTDPR